MVPVQFVKFERSIVLRLKFMAMARLSSLRTTSTFLSLEALLRITSRRPNRTKK